MSTSPTIEELWPHTCPECGERAYIGGDGSVECVSSRWDGCRHASVEARKKYAELVVKNVDRVAREYTAQWDDEDAEPKGLAGWLPDDIDDDEDTQPQAKPFKWFPNPNLSDLFEGVEETLELALRPFGTVEVSRQEALDAIDIVLYNPPTALYLCETFELSVLKSIAENGGNVADWLARHCVYQFPRELASAWDYKQHQAYFEDLVTPMTPDDARPGATRDEYTFEAEAGMTKYLNIGQYIKGYRVVGIDRSKDTFTIID